MKAICAALNIQQLMARMSRHYGEKAAMTRKKPLDDIFVVFLGHKSKSVILSPQTALILILSGFLI
jgi:hypothetical protein